MSFIACHGPFGSGQWLHSAGTGKLGEFLEEVNRRHIHAIDKLYERRLKEVAEGVR